MAPEQTSFSSQICARLPKTDFIFLLTLEKQRRRCKKTKKKPTQPPPAHFTEEPPFVSLNSQKCLCCRGRFSHILLSTGSEHVLLSIPGGWVGGGGVFWSAACALINLPKRRWRWKPWRASCSGSPEPLVQPEALLRRLLFFSSRAGRNLGRGASVSYHRALGSSLTRSGWLESLLEGARLHRLGWGWGGCHSTSGRGTQHFFFLFFVSGKASNTLLRLRSCRGLMSVRRGEGKK